MASAQKTEMITIDGSQGEGGGQILRTSLALSLVSGQPFRMERVRAKRQKPGLLKQHLTAVVLVSKLPEHVAERELTVVRDELKWRADECGVEAVPYPV